MESCGRYIVLSVEQKKETVRASGIVTLADNQSFTTNSGDKVGTNSVYRVFSVGPEVKLNVKEGDEVICNPWAVQLFEHDNTTYAVVPDLEVKVVL